MLKLLTLLLTVVGPSFQVETASREPKIGLLEKLDSSGLKLENTEAIPLKQLVGFTQLNRPRPSLPRGPQVILANGDRLAGVVEAGSENSAKLRLSQTQELLELPTSAITAIWWGTLPATAPLDPPEYPWLDANKREDTLLLKNGDRLSGTFEGFGENPFQVRLKSKGAEAQAVPVEQVRALVLSPELARVRLPKGSYAKLILRDGSRLSGQLTADANSFSCKLLTGATLKLGQDQVVEVELKQNGNFTLQELKPALDEKPFNTLAGTAPLRGQFHQDRHAVLTPRGSDHFEDSLIVRPGTNITVKLNGEYQSFMGYVGFNARTKRGLSRVSLLLDGKVSELPDAGLLQAGMPAIRLRVPLQGVKELVLKVEPGDVLGNEAEVNLAGWRFVKK